MYGCAASPVESRCGVARKRSVTRLPICLGELPAGQWVNSFCAGARGQSAMPRMKAKICGHLIDMEGSILSAVLTAVRAISPQTKTITTKGTKVHEGSQMVVFL